MVALCNLNSKGATRRNVSTENEQSKYRSYNYYNHYFHVIDSLYH